MAKTRLMSLVFAGVAVGGANCQARDLCDFEGRTLTNRHHATGSSTMAASADGSFVLSANATENSVSLLQSNGTQLLHELEVGAEPERIARVGDQFVVSLRGERSLARLAVEAGRLRVVETIATGAEPIGLVADEQGERLYVAVSQSGVVEQRDASTMAVIRSIPIPHEPRWLALHPTGNTLYVATAFGGHLFTVDTETGASNEVVLPDVNTFDNEGDFQSVPRSKRITGDITVRPDGSELLVPMLFVDNINSVDGGEAIPGDDSGYGSSGGGKRFEPAVVTMNLDNNGIPDRADEVETISVFDHQGMSRESYITSVTVHPTEPVAYATMEASDTVVAIDIDNTDGRCEIGAPSDSSRRNLGLKTSNWV